MFISTLKEFMVVIRDNHRPFVFPLTDFPTLDIIADLLDGSPRIVPLFRTVALERRIFPCIAYQRADSRDGGDGLYRTNYYATDLWWGAMARCGVDLLALPHWEWLVGDIVVYCSHFTDGSLSPEDVEPIPETLRMVS